MFIRDTNIEELYYILRAKGAEQFPIVFDIKKGFDTPNRNIIELEVDYFKKEIVIIKEV